MTSTSGGAEAAIGSPVMPTLLAGGRRATASPGVWSVFTVPNYRRFVAGQSISLVGSWTETIAIALLVLSVTHSSITLGLVVATRYLPVLLLTPYAGLIVDRHDKRRLLMLTSTVLGLTTMAVGAAVLGHVIAIWQVFLSAMIFGVMTSLDNPARMALIPELVGTALIRQAITTNSVLANVGRALGPVAAAVLVARYGLGWCFVFNAASFALVVIALVTLDARTLNPTVPVRRSGGQLRDGLAVALRNRDIAGPLSMMVFVGTLTYEFETSLPIFAEQTLHGGATTYSALTTAFGVGSVAAGLALIRWPQTGLPRMLTAAAGFGVAMLLLVVSPSRDTAVAAAALVGVASIAFLTTGNGTIQIAAPPEMRGRVTGLWTTAFVGSTPLGAVIIGVVAREFGGRGALAVGVIGCVAALVAGLLVLRRSQRYFASPIDLP